MSDIRGCIRCKVQFEVYNLQTKLCINCKRIREKENNARNNRHVGEIFRECPWCKKIVDVSLGKKYCSDTCRTKYCNLPTLIKRAKIQLKKQQERIVKLESLL